VLQYIAEGWCEGRKGERQKAFAETCNASYLYQALFLVITQGNLRYRACVLILGAGEDVVTVT
jgi:hypothetical protein